MKFRFFPAGVCQGWRACTAAEPLISLQSQQRNCLAVTPAGATLPLVAAILSCGADAVPFRCDIKLGDSAAAGARR